MCTYINFDKASKCEKLLIRNQGCNTVRMCIDCTNLSFLENTLKWICIFAVVCNVVSITFLNRDEELQYVSSETGRLFVYIDLYRAPHISWGFTLLSVRLVGTLYPLVAVPHSVLQRDGCRLQTKQNGHTWPGPPGLHDFCLVSPERYYSFSL